MRPVRFSLLASLGLAALASSVLFARKSRPPRPSILDTVYS